MISLLFDCCEVVEIARSLRFFIFIERTNNYKVKERGLEMPNLFDPIKRLNNFPLDPTAIQETYTSAQA